MLIISFVGFSIWIFMFVWLMMLLLYFLKYVDVFSFFIFLMMLLSFVIIFMSSDVKVVNGNVFENLSFVIIIILFSCFISMCCFLVVVVDFCFNVLVFSFENEFVLFGLKCDIFLLCGVLVFWIGMLFLCLSGDFVLFWCEKLLFGLKCDLFLLCGVLVYCLSGDLVLFWCDMLLFVFLFICCVMDMFWLCLLLLLFCEMLLLEMKKSLGCDLMVELSFCNVIWSFFESIFGE